MPKAIDGRGRAPDPAHSSGWQRPWALSPSDLVFLWEECPRCFYRKVVQARPRPRAPFPKVFGLIDRAMKAFALGQRAEHLAPGAPAGIIGSPDRWVRSDPIAVPGCTRPVVLRGRLDGLVTAADGSVAVVDFKTAPPREPHLPFYARQLHAYAWALEQPHHDFPTSVSALGLLCFIPSVFDAQGRIAALRGALEWIEVPRDDLAFVDFLAEVAWALDGPEPPAPGSDCGWCRSESTRVTR